MMTSLCDICNMCFVKIVGIENLTTYLDFKIYAYTKPYPPKLVILQILVKFDQLSPSMKKPDLHPCS